MKAKLFRGCFVSLIVAAALYPALAANPGGSGPVGKTPAATLQTIPGSTVKRVILTPKAAERLGIETGKVSEQAIVRKQMVGGLVIPPMEKTPESKPGSGVWRLRAGEACSRVEAGQRRIRKRRAAGDPSGADGQWRVRRLRAPSNATGADGKRRVWKLCAGSACPRVQAGEQGVRRR